MFVFISSFSSPLPEITQSHPRNQEVLNYSTPAMLCQRTLLTSGRSANGECAECQDRFTLANVNRSWERVSSWREPRDAPGLEMVCKSASLLSNSDQLWAEHLLSDKWVTAVDQVPKSAIRITSFPFERPEPPVSGPQRDSQKLVASGAGLFGFGHVSPPFTMIVQIAQVRFQCSTKKVPCPDGTLGAFWKKLAEGLL